MKAFILAGGFATRLWPLTEKRAKPLLPLGGKPMLTHIVEDIPAEIPITVSTNAVFGDAMRRWKEGLPRANLTVRVEQTENDDQKLGTLGAVSQWITEDGINDDILLLTGDNYFGFSMQRFLDAYEPGTALVAAFDIQDKELAKSFGTIVPGPHNTIAAFEEKPKNPQSTLVSTGASVLPSSVRAILLAFAKIKPDNVGGIFEELLRLGTTVRLFTFTEPWFDVGSFHSYLAATRTLAGDTVIRGNATTLEDTLCEGSVVLGNGSTVQSSRLKNTVLFDHCAIEDCILEDCILDNNCVLKGVDLTGKMLREGTRLVKDGRR